MENIQSFTPEVCRELNYYVYRLVDPRNGRTFYVGKGKNNRVFAHAACALDRYADADYDPLTDDDENLKYRTIREIKNAGLEVIYIIQRYGMNEHDALVAESVLIDAYSLLTNRIKGFGGTEPQNALTLQKTLSTPEYVDRPSKSPLHDHQDKSVLDDGGKRPLRPHARLVARRSEKSQPIPLCPLCHRGNRPRGL